MNYHEKSKEELLAILDDVALAIGGDIIDPLCQDIVARARTLVADRDMTLGKYHLLMVEYAMAFGIDGAGLMEPCLRGGPQDAPEELRKEIDRFKGVARIKLERANQLREAEVQHASQNAAFAQMIAARKADEISRSAPAQIADGIMSAAGYSDSADLRHKG